ncbi:MAG: diaminopimelate decarboxylase [Lachnospiraceae bacterium]|nr:diaminopimelate decarboxylase [Lachnospiraceae bacterium]
MMKTPFVTKEMVEEIVKSHPTPFHIYDEKGIRENAKALREAFAWNKGYKEFFAVKATPNPFIMEILKECGCGCDCSSLTELMLSKAVGITGRDIMFSSNDTPPQEFAYAARLGAIINLDDFTHIDFLERTIGYIPETISCRYNPGGYFEIANSIMDNPGDAKYGFTEKQLFEGFKILKEKGAKQFGIHAFLASNTVTNDYYPTLAGTMFELAVRLQRETGAHISFINLSGGIGIPYKPDETGNDIRIIGEGVRRAYEEILTPAGMGDVAIYTELGRFMLAPYGHLVTQAIHEKHTHKEYIGVDACAVNLMRPAMYGAYHHITVLGKENEPCSNQYDVVGSLCENNDKFAIDRMLPVIDRGDYLVIHDTGAHGFSMGYNYNGKLRSAELLLKEDGSVQMIRRAETPRDYFATFDCFGVYDQMDWDA